MLRIKCQPEDCKSKQLATSPTTTRAPDGAEAFGRVGFDLDCCGGCAAEGHKSLTTTVGRGRPEVEQPKVGPEGVRLAGASESKNTERGAENLKLNSEN